MFLNLIFCQGNKSCLSASLNWNFFLQNQKIKGNLSAFPCHKLLSLSIEYQNSGTTNRIFSKISTFADIFLIIAHFCLS